MHSQLSPEQLVETLVSFRRRESHIEPARKPVKRKRPDAEQLPAASGCDSAGFVATDSSQIQLQQLAAVDGSEFGQKL